jgi:hypothetical protein
MGIGFVCMNCVVEKKMKICRKAKECQTKPGCPHKVPHDDMGPDCWPNGEVCPGCRVIGEEDEPPTEFCQKKRRVINSQSLMVDWRLRKTNAD